jgi:2-haloacid dehalogenase
MKLTDFRVLTFDCYGTLIDWESGIFDALQPLIEASGKEIDRDYALETFAQHEAAQEAETPTMIYADLLAVVHRRLASEWNVKVADEMHQRFGVSVPHWPAFPDSADALSYLKQHYKLVILSNVDRTSFAGSNARLGVTFDGIYTAQDIGSYKPSPRNFDYMLAELLKLGYGKRDILHTAQSLFHDHQPAQALGLASAWIDRRHDQQGFGATMPPAAGAAYDFRFPSLRAMAEAHRAELSRRG